MNFDKQNKHPNNFNQIVLQAKLRKAQSGVEMLDFTIPLGIAEFHCSIPIPDEGTDGSPVYVHVKPARQTPTFGLSTSQGPRVRRPRTNGGNYRSDDFEEDEDFGNRA